MLLAAAKMDDDYKKNLLPTDFENWNQIIDYIGETEKNNNKIQGYDKVELPPFVKNALITIVQRAQNEN